MKGIEDRFNVLKNDILKETQLRAESIDIINNTLGVILGWNLDLLLYEI